MTADPFEMNQPDISSCSWDREKSSSPECSALSKDPGHLNLNDYEAMEELDFEDEKIDSDGLKYSKVLQTSIQQNLNPESYHGTKNVESESVEVKCPVAEKPLLGKENCVESDMEEGEMLDDGECVEVEDGEISEASKPEDLQKISCRFFQRGKCIYGRECRFLHLSDKGCYNMFDSPVKQIKPVLQNIPYVKEPNYRYRPPPLPPMIVEKSSERQRVQSSQESMWDKALEEAKERIQMSKMHRNDSFEDGMHMKVEKQDRYVKKLTAPKHPSDRVFRESDSEKPHSFMSQLNAAKPRRWKQSDTAKPNMSKNVLDRNSSFHSEWNDPWRRSKTPPTLKRLRSKSISDSSSLSSESSLSSWTSSKSGQSPSSKRFKSCRTVQKHSRSRSFGATTNRWSRSSSCSPRKSASPRSRSPSSKFYSRKSQNHKRKSFRSPSSSPVYHRIKRPHSPDVVLPFRKKPSVSPPLAHQRREVSKKELVQRKQKDFSKRSPSFTLQSRSPEIVLPYRKPNSVTPPPVHRKKELSKREPVVKKHQVLSKRSPSFTDRSRSPSSKPASHLFRSATPPLLLSKTVFKGGPVGKEQIVSTKHIPSFKDKSGSTCFKSASHLLSPYRYGSCSDMSISPISDASLCKIYQPLSDKESKTSQLAKGISNSKKKGYKTGAPEPDIVSAPVSQNADKAQTGQTVKKQTEFKSVKHFKVLEAELMRFAGITRKKPPPKNPESVPSSITRKNPPPKNPESIPSSIKVESSFKKTDSQTKQSKEVPVVDVKIVKDERFSKRDVLLQKLKAVEEAIARKKQTLG